MKFLGLRSRLGQFEIYEAKLRVVYLIKLMKVTKVHRCQEEVKLVFISYSKRRFKEKVSNDLKWTVSDKNNTTVRIGIMPVSRQGRKVGSN